MSRIVFWVLIGAVAVITLWAGSAALIFRLYPHDPTARGTFGDLFGAVNALFSGLAFLGVVVALVIQGEQLRLQQQEIREGQEAQRRDESRAAFLAKLEALNNALDIYGRWI